MSRFITDREARPVSATVAVVVTLLTLGYMLPWMIATLRGKSNHWGVFWLNLLLGWTILGWVGALVMSVLPHQRVGVRY
jgi:ABC-type transport system involved in cytochrome c biogenesis permease component